MGGCVAFALCWGRQKRKSGQRTWWWIRTLSWLSGEELEEFGGNGSYIYIYSIYIRFSLGVLLSTLKCNAHLIELLDLGTPTLLTSLIHPLVAAGEETVCLDAACSFIMSLWEEQTLVLSRPQDFYSICFWHLLAIRARPQE